MFNNLTEREKQKLRDLQEENESEYDKAIKDEIICPECKIEMKFVKGKPRKTNWDKYHDYYICSFCGFKHRKRTNNEILRDIGERD